jgi:calcineurin-like phosphoesterase family protein
MTNTFLISDTHFSHANILTFKKEDGLPLRPFSSVEEMDEEMIKRWNEVVKPNDKVYHLGDVAIPKKGLDCLARLNGDKVLIRGNHDTQKLKDYTKYFRDIRGYHVLENMIFSHIPVHPDSKGRFKANIHGHLHARRVTMDSDIEISGDEIKIERIIDPYYYCVSVENIDYRPISFEEIKTIINK